jgi:transaldolase
VQRPLWASTSTKNPAYRDVIYVEELIGTNTVNTLPPATLEAFRDHGDVRASVTENVADADRVLSALESQGVSLQAVTDTLLAEGLASFEHSFVTLLSGLNRKRAALARLALARLASSTGAPAVANL